MKVQFEPKISLGNLISIGTIIVGLFFGGCAFYIMMPVRVQNVETRVANVEKAVEKISVTLQNRAAVSDQNFSEVKTSLAVAQNSQTMLIKQMADLQQDVRNLVNAQLNSNHKSNASAAQQRHPAAALQADNDNLPGMRYKQEVNYQPGM